MNINRRSIDEYFNEIKLTGKNLVKSQITLSIITLTILTVSFYLLDIKYAFLIALGITVVDILPVVGSGIVMLPWAAYLMISKTDVQLGLKIAGVYIGLTILRQVLEPVIRGKTLGLTPVVTAVSCIIGFICFQGIGLIIGPVVAILGQIAYKIFIKYKEIPEKRD